MSSPKSHVVAGVLVAAAAAALFLGPPAFGYVSGRLAAGATLRAGRAELRSLGMQHPDRAFDPEIGLFRRSMGCAVTPWMEGYARGWNAATRAAIEAGETESVSLRRKVRTLDAVKAAFAADAGRRLSADGPLVDPTECREVVVDDTRLRVRDVATGDVGETIVCLDGGAGRALFADDGTTLLLESSNDRELTIRTIDLPSGRGLQGWSEWIGPPPKGCPGPR